MEKLEDILREGLKLMGQEVTEDALRRFRIYYERLTEVGSVMNLTAIKGEGPVATLHFLDSAALLRYADFSGARVLDVGTGAGFPGMPLAILCPGTEFVLLDALRKRVDFLNEVIDALGLTNCTAVHARAEEFAAAHRERFDAATSRAVAELRTLCEFALPMVKVGGTFYAMKAADCGDEIAAAANAIDVLGAAAPTLLHYTVPHDGVERVIVRLHKTAQTPAQYPRRFKKIQSAPL